MNPLEKRNEKTVASAASVDVMAGTKRVMERKNPVDLADAVAITFKTGGGAAQSRRTLLTS